MQLSGKLRLYWGLIRQYRELAQGLLRWIPISVHNLCPLKMTLIKIPVYGGVFNWNVGSLSACSPMIPNAYCNIFPRCHYIFAGGWIWDVLCPQSVLSMGDVDQSMRAVICARKIALNRAITSRGKSNTLAIFLSLSLVSVRKSAAAPKKIFSFGSKRKESLYTCESLFTSC